VLSADTPLRVRQSDATGSVRVTAGDTFHFAMRVASPWGEPRPYLPGPEIREPRPPPPCPKPWAGTGTGTTGSAGFATPASPWPPCGWAACPDEAGDFFTFLATAAGGRIAEGQDLQILYGVGGERLVPEPILDHLDGYRNSRPVRIGNGAWNQRQLDVYGELLNAAWTYAGEIDQFDPVTAQFLIDAADAAAARWTQPDHGIWELRGPRRHFLHSKLMWWVALERAIGLADRLGASHRVADWTSVRDRIRVAIETRGWSQPVGAYTQSFGTDDLDASSLMLLLGGFLPPQDQRMRATVEAVAASLSHRHGLVYRYRNPDGQTGEEGTFAIHTSWLIQAVAEMGQIDRARNLFDRIATYANDLFSEEIDPHNGQLLGNFPQAFTHIGLVNAAWAIARAENRHGQTAGT
jgi:GH15 family glucan-1,4-alpha-glucosidase